MDLMKHSMVFDATAFNILPKSNCVVIGVGAVGNVVAMQLAKLGIANLMLFDDDKVEPHNLPNQMCYGLGDIGEYKGAALANRIYDATGCVPMAYKDKVHGRRYRSTIGSYVFMCVDSMAARSEILDNTISLNPGVELVIDGRMGTHNWASYAFRPKNLAHVNRYRTTLHPDEEVAPQQVGACRIVPSIGATAGVLANCMIWQFITHISGSTKMRNEVAGCVEPWQTHLDTVYQDY